MKNSIVYLNNICIFGEQLKQIEIMNNFNNTLTIEEARVILSNRASFVNNPHNRKMIAEATHEILVKIQNK